MKTRATHVWQPQTAPHYESTVNKELRGIHINGSSSFKRYEWVRYVWDDYTLRHKKLHSSYWYNNFAKLCHTVMILAHRCTWEYPIACLFDSLCKIENWEPA